MSSPANSSQSCLSNAIWFSGNWHIPIISSCIYLLLIYLGVKVMESRKGYALKEFLFLWNLILAVFSTIGAINLFQNSMILVHQQSDIKQTLCTYKYPPGSGACFWITAFTFSKIYEFGDTIFIVLRKKPLMFLHYYHHASVLMVTWLFLSHESMFTIVMCPACVNFTVHSIMYGYYCLSAIGVIFPRFVPMLITLLQLTQMFTYGSMYLIGYYMCEGIPILVVLIGVATVASYAVLFIVLFYNRYIAKNGKEKTY